MTATATKERPILFSGPMVRAILAGRKTQTRRIVKGVGVFVATEMAMSPPSEDDPGVWVWPDGTTVRSPYGVPGDRLWVRETFSLSTTTLPLTGTGARWDVTTYPRPRVWFSANNDRPTWAETTWKPSIFMPRWASRLTLEITDVRVERLQDISESDSQYEGFQQTEHMLARRRFELLWEEINGANTWADNPWVWVVSFTKEAV